MGAAPGLPSCADISRGGSRLYSRLYRRTDVVFYSSLCMFPFLFRAQRRSPYFTVVRVNFDGGSRLYGRSPWFTVVRGHFEGVVACIAACIGVPMWSFIHHCACFHSFLGLSGAAHTVVRVNFDRGSRLYGRSPW